MHYQSMLYRFFFAGSLGRIGGIFEDPQGFLKGPGHRIPGNFFLFPKSQRFLGFSG